MNYYILGQSPDGSKPKRIAVTEIQKLVSTCPKQDSFSENQSVETPLSHSIGKQDREQPREERESNHVKSEIAELAEKRRKLIEEEREMILGKYHAEIEVQKLKKEVLEMKKRTQSLKAQYYEAKLLSLLK